LGFLSPGGCVFFHYLIGGYMYKEYFDEHPEEYENIRAIKLQTRLYEIERAKKVEEKQKKIREWEEKLNAVN